MAVTSTIEYCTDRDIYDVYPQVKSSDSKTRIYGWTSLFSHGGFALHEAFNTGLVTVLFQNGEDLTPYQKVEDYSDSTANTNEAVDIIETAIDVTDGSVFGYGDIIRIDSEKMLVTNISSNTVTVKRGFLGTTTATHNTGTDIYIGVEWSESKQWLFSEGNDSVLLYEPTGTDPNDLIMEAGEDAATFTQRYRRNASRYVESKLDSRMASEISLDREGLYPYIIKRTTALVAVAMMIKAEDPMDDVGNAFMEEANGYLDGLRTGEIQLPTSVTGDSPYGVIRDVSYTSGKIRPIQTRGSYSGTYDLIKIKIIDAGEIGTATYSVWEKSSTDLKATNIVSAETINGDYQQCAGGLEIRFAGATDATTASAGDEWEIEVYGIGEDVRVSNVGNINMTRGAYHIGKMRYKGGYRRVGHRKMKL